MPLKIIDLYIGIAGLMGLILASGIIVYTLYQLVIRRNWKSLLIFIGLGALFFMKMPGQILIIAAIALIYIDLCYYFFFVIRGFWVKNKAQKIRLRDYPHISILIPAKNEGKVIKETLISVSQLDYPKSNYDIIVIDDGSTDNTRDLVLRLKTINNLKLIHHPASLGKANSLNKVVAEINSEYVLIMDADHLIERDFLLRALPSFEKPDVVCVQGKNVVRNGKACLLSRLIEMEYEERYEIILSGRIMPQFMGSAGMFRTSALKEMGGFNPGVLTEDFEISHRAYLKGYRIVFDASLKTYELAPVDLKNFFIQRHRWFRGNWQTLTRYFTDLVKSSKITWPAKIEIANNYIELMALFCYLFLNILCALDLFKVIQFDFKYLVYIQSLNLILLYAITVINSKKFGLLTLLPCIPFYYILFAIPTFMAMIDNWILKTEFKWNKLDRTNLKEPGRLLMKQEVATGVYNETNELIIPLAVSEETANLAD